MQFGEPPLFSVLNLAMRTGDLNYLQTLGPYACAMLIATGSAEEGRTDRIEQGIWITENRLSLGYLRGCFIIFRGGPMK